MPGAYLWGWDGAAFRQVKTDLAGHLQVDVVTTPFPVGFATSANQVITHGYIDGIEGLLGGGLPAALVAGSLSVINNAASEQHCYGWDTANWQKLLVESAVSHNLRVRLYGGGNAIAEDPCSNIGFDIATKRGLYVRSQPILATTGTAGIPWGSAALQADGIGGHYQGAVALWGFNGATFDRLRTEAAGVPNLRVKLYDGANGIDSELGSNADIADAKRGLVVNSLLRLQCSITSTWKEWRTADSANDASIGLDFPCVGLMGYNGGAWDRLRTYGTGILKVGRAEVGLLDVRMTGTGQVGAAGARKLYWMLLNPSAGNSVVELTDATAGGAAVKADHFDTTRDGHMITFDPPLEFSNGIYLETFSNMTSITFGYL